MRWFDLAALVFMVGATACGTKDPAATEKHPDAVACTALDYEEFGRGFLTRWCASCHAAGLAEGQRYGAPLGLNFDSYGRFQQHQDAALASALALSMPPGATIPAEELASFEEWVSCGAPGVGATESVPTAEPPSSVPSTVVGCAWEGTWTVQGVACNGTPITDGWNEQFPLSEIAFHPTGDAGSCRLEVYRADEDCAEVQAWGLDAVEGAYAISLNEVEICEPFACALGPLVCEERLLNTVSPVEVAELEGGRLLLSDMQGFPFCSGDVSFELVR